MATKKAKEKGELVDLTDNALGHKILDAKSTLDELETFVGKTKAECFSRIDDHGTKEGKHFVIRDGDILLKKEVRSSVSVLDNEAVKLLTQKKFDNKIDVTATIEIKRGVDVTAIPEKLRKDIEKYFEITLHKSVDRDVLNSLKENGQITGAQYDKCITTKETYAFKVEKI